MTATEELRRLLDERGVEWWPMHDVENGYREDRDTEFLIYGCKHVAHEWGCRLQVDMLTPEQAVAATLGPRTCKVVSSTLHEYEGGYAGSEWEHELSCGDTVWWGSGDAPEWCPWCGAKVVS